MEMLYLIERKQEKHNSQRYSLQSCYLSLYSNGQRVAVRALGGGHLLHVPMWLQHKFLGHGLVIGVSKAQAAIAAFSTRFH